MQLPQERAILEVHIALYGPIHIKSVGMRCLICSPYLSVGLALVSFLFDSCHQFPTRSLGFIDLFKHVFPIVRVEDIPKDLGSAAVDIVKHGFSLVFDDYRKKFYYLQF